MMIQTRLFIQLVINDGMSKVKFFLVRGIVSDFVKRHYSLILCSLLTHQRVRIFC